MHCTAHENWVRCPAPSLIASPAKIPLGSKGTKSKCANSMALFLSYGLKWEMVDSIFMLADFICCGCKIRGVQIKRAAFLQQELKYYFAKAWSWLD